MWKRISGRKLGRNTNQRKALFRNLASQLIIREAITTTEAKAKAVKPFIEKLITIARSGSLNSRRALLSEMTQESLVKKMIERIGPTFKDRPGGYTRIFKLGPRVSDSAKMVRIEFVENIAEKEKTVRKEQKRPQIKVKEGAKKRQAPKKPNKTKVKAV